MRTKQQKDTQALYDYVVNAINTNFGSMNPSTVTEQQLNTALEAVNRPLTQGLLGIGTNKKGAMNASRHNAFFNGEQTLMLASLYSAQVMPKAECVLNRLQDTAAASAWQAATGVNVGEIPTDPNMIGSSQGDSGIMYNINITATDATSLERVYTSMIDYAHLLFTTKVIENMHTKAVQILVTDPANKVKKITKWVLIGGGIAAGVGITIALLNKDNDDSITVVERRDGVDVDVDDDEYRTHVDIDDFDTPEFAVMDRSF